jgi:hypothetical protein
VRGDGGGVGFRVHDSHGFEEGAEADGAEVDDAEAGDIFGAEVDEILVAGAAYTAPGLSLGASVAAERTNHEPSKSE